MMEHRGKLTIFAVTVKTSDYILKKFRGHPPSLILHLHPTNFRFQNQDGSFGYNSPMKLFLEAVREQTIPHELVEDFAAAGVQFYEGT
jgi:transcription factor SPT20